MWNAATSLCMVIVALSPLSALGGTLTNGIAGLLCATCMLSAAMAIRPGEAAFLRSVATRPAAVAAALALWPWFQMLPIASLANPIWKTAADQLTDSASGRITIDVAASLDAGILWLACLCLGLATAAVGIEPRRADRLRMTIIAATALLSILCLTFQVLPPALSQELFPHGPQGLTPALTIGLCSAFASLLDRGGDDRTRRSFTHPRNIALLAAAMSAAIAVWHVGSYQLAIPCVVAIGTIFLLAQARRFALSSWNAVVIWLVLAAIGAGAAFASRPDSSVPLVTAFSSSTSDQTSATVAMLADTPRFGSGSAAALWPTYLGLQDTPDMSQTVTAAATACASFGAAYFWSIVVLMIMIISALIHCAMHRGRDWSYTAGAAGALVAVIMISFMSPIDPLTATAIPLAALLGIGTAQSRSRVRL